MTGRRADLIVVDDPISSRADAESKTVRDSTWAWYRADLSTRLKPGGRIVLIMTRWHEDDLAARLLADAAEGGDQWDVLCLPALALGDDPLGRKPGEPLWPDWEDAAALDRRLLTLGDRDWSSLYMQAPRPQEGAIFKVGQIPILDDAPRCSHVVRAWDIAATAQSGTRNPDWTVGLKLGRTETGQLAVLDVVRFRGGPHDVEQQIVQTGASDGRSVTIGLAQDPGAAGKMVLQYLTRRLAGHRIESSPETGSKVDRSLPVASQANVGNIAIVRAYWNPTF